MHLKFLEYVYLKKKSITKTFKKKYLVYTNKMELKTINYHNVYSNHLIDCCINFRYLNLITQMLYVFSKSSIIRWKRLSFLEQVEPSFLDTHLL